MSRQRPWAIDGPARGQEHPGLEDALRRLWLSQSRAPTEADVPPPSTFPVTRAAREALRYTRESDAPAVSVERRRRLTFG